MLQTVLSFVQQHWESVVIVATALVVLFDKLKKKAYQEFLAEAMIAVERVAVLELSGVEKRDRVIDDVYRKLPAWVVSLIPNDTAKQIAEQAYQLLRADLKQREESKKVSGE
jgi:hypothetical protein